MLKPVFGMSEQYQDKVLTEMILFWTQNYTANIMLEYKPPQIFTSVKTSLYFVVVVWYLNEC